MYKFSLLFQVIFNLIKTHLLEICINQDIISYLDLLKKKIKTINHDIVDKICLSLI